MAKSTPKSEAAAELPEVALSGVAKRCFVIMPFGQTTAVHTESYWTEMYELFLRPLIQEIPDLVAMRSQPGRTDVIGEIVKELLTADIVVADLTDANPSVYWELGVRQSFKYGTVTIAEYGTKLGFDLSTK